MKKSVCIEMLFTEVPFEDRFGLAKGSGFDYIEFWSWKEKDIQKIKELCRVYDLKIASFSGDQDFSMVDENQKEDYIAFVQESIEIAKLLDCNNLVIHSNALGENGVVINHYPNIAQTNKIAAMLDVLKTLAMEAEKSNVTLVLEALNTMVDHSGNFLASTREAAELIKSVNSSYIKILYDVYHMQIMEGNIINTLKAYIDVIGYIHIADVPGRHEPGTGEINFSNIMKTLKK
ncbi:MAG: TIM barrel protein, partial [Desulfobacterales bacterium]|nr:TIM barrel protein [Desulfobacterales bacterium]